MSTAMCAVTDMHRTAVHRHVRVERQVDVDVNRADEKREHAERKSRQEADQVEA
jgi:hypothetical protein